MESPQGPPGRTDVVRSAVEVEILRAEGWVQSVSNDDVFWYNQVTGESSWFRPDPRLIGESSTLLPPAPEEFFGAPLGNAAVIPLSRAFSDVFPSGDVVTEDLGRLVAQPITGPIPPSSFSAVTRPIPAYSVMVDSPSLSLRDGQMSQSVSSTVASELSAHLGCDGASARRGHIRLQLAGLDVLSARFRAATALSVSVWSADGSIRVSEELEVMLPNAPSCETVFVASTVDDRQLQLRAAISSEHGALVHGLGTLALHVQPPADLAGTAAVALLPALCSVACALVIQPFDGGSDSLVELSACLEYLPVRPCGNRTFSVC
jgi:hypothetical protein